MRLFCWLCGSGRLGLGFLLAKGRIPQAAPAEGKSG
jgi:hypothetical protein